MAAGRTVLRQQTIPLMVVHRPQKLGATTGAIEKLIVPHSDLAAMAANGSLDKKPYAG
jgi:hypothetical protein